MSCNSIAKRPTTPTQYIPNQCAFNAQQAPIPHTTTPSVCTHAHAHPPRPKAKLPSAKSLTEHISLHLATYFLRKTARRDHARNASLTNPPYTAYTPVHKKSLFDIVVNIGLSPAVARRPGEAPPCPSRCRADQGNGRKKNHSSRSNPATALTYAYAHTHPPLQTGTLQSTNNHA